MKTNIEKIGLIDEVKLFYDPLRQDDSFLVNIKDGDTKMGFINRDEILLESNFKSKWEDVRSIIAGYNTMENYYKIKDKINN